MKFVIFINNKEDLKNSTIGILKGIAYTPMVEKWKQQGLIQDYKFFYDYYSLETALKNEVVEAIITVLYQQKIFF